jgi:hypothetical protein
MMLLRPNSSFSDTSVLPWENHGIKKREASVAKDQPRLGHVGKNQYSTAPVGDVTSVSQL